VKPATAPRGKQAGATAKAALIVAAVKSRPAKSRRASASPSAAAIQPREISFARETKTWE